MAGIADAIGMMSDEPRRLPSANPVDVGSEFVANFLTWLDTHRDELHEDRSVEDYLRASGLHAVCGRRTAILSVYPHLTKPERHSIGSMLTFDVGHALHWWWQNRYLGPAGKLWGPWYCARCDAVVHTGFMPAQCPECEGEWQRVLTYEEMHLQFPDLRLAGHPDGLVSLNGRSDNLKLLELKSLSSSRYERLTGPDPNHVIQVHPYMVGTETTEALIVYIDKGKQADWRFRNGSFSSSNPHVTAFHVEFNRHLWSRLRLRVATHWEVVALTQDRPLTESDIEAVPRVCLHDRASMAKRCPAVDRCFELEDRS